MSGIEKLIELGVEILPKWDGKPSLLIKKGDKIEKIECIHSVVYQGNVENMPKTLSAEHIQEKAKLPDVETRKFAFRSFVEALVENFPRSISKEMIGENLARRIRQAFMNLEFEGFYDNSLDALLADVEDSWEEFRNAYFWSPPGSASGRRSYESRHSWSRTIRIRHQTARTDRTFIIEVDFDVSCSCKNIYVNKSILINKQKINLTKFRGFCNKIEEGKSIPYSYIK